MNIRLTLIAVALLAAFVTGRITNDPVAHAQVGGVWTPTQADKALDGWQDRIVSLRSLALNGAQSIERANTELGLMSTDADNVSLIAAITANAVANPERKRRMDEYIEEFTELKGVVAAQDAALKALP